MQAWYSAGMELIFYPVNIRTFFVRVSAGFDIHNLVKTGSLFALVSVQILTRDSENGLYRAIQLTPQALK